ncbi:MlaD family protein [Gordonia polyisoprenivorans]|uniref:MlaD family protein n=1 Tax=Gordonia polyisoprenivorans TaxID=84595 RepID=UPI001AD7BE80|nr:MCE family protein [Gordonia polyisoprenivorans]QTI68988.1 MCE family protein [Gordonia polyisoprenivorans]
MVVPILRLVGAGLVAVLLFVLIQNAITNPTSSRTSAYSADFSDASGLRPNSDVRIRGVRVGKVSEVSLEQSGDATMARVSFSLDDNHYLTSASKLAIKYANLSGVRFVDITDADGSGGRTSHVGVAQTVPSFDITTLFNGMQPALETLAPSEVNEFTQNALTLLQGNGEGLEPLMASIDKLSRYASNREQMISTLVDNLAGVAQTLGGHAPDVVQFLRDVERPIDKAMTVLDEFRKGAAYGPGLMGSINQILIGLGISDDLDVDKTIAQAFPSVQGLWTALDMLPTVAAGLSVQADAGQVSSSRCSRGVAELPATVRVLLNGSSVVVCNG